MKFLVCLLGFFVAVAIWAFVVARQFVRQTMDMLRGGGVHPKGHGKENIQPGSRDNESPKSKNEGLFEQEGRQYVDFEEVKEE